MRDITKELKKEIIELGDLIEQATQVEMSRVDAAISDIASEMISRMDIIETASKREEKLIVKKAHQEVEKEVRNEFIKQIRAQL